MQKIFNCHHVVRTSVWSTPYSGVLQSKLYRQDFRDVTDVNHLKHVLLQWSHKSDAIKGCQTNC